MTLPKAPKPAWLVKLEQLRATVGGEIRLSPGIVIRFSEGEHHYEQCYSVDELKRPLPDLVFELLVKLHIEFGWPCPVRS